MGEVSQSKYRFYTDVSLDVCRVLGHSDRGVMRGRDDCNTYCSELR